MSTELPITIETLMEQCGGMAVVAQSVLDEFLTQVATDIAEMETKLAGGDLLGASKAAHRLKGTAGVLGAAKLHSLCQAVEFAGKEGRGDDAKNSFAGLKVESQRCVDAVPAVRASVK
ncbi:MAG: Hpt domain-containing protein [Planctomycetaceae bacterium]|jgi:HPt (histidine-containing phosphotransfer) domain-containing protein|nr:Hpt domain-containing protein [Planctomycetaceae bacterium]